MCPYLLLWVHARPLIFKLFLKESNCTLRTFGHNTFARRTVISLPKYMLFPVYTESNKTPSSQVAAEVFQPG